MIPPEQSLLDLFNNFVLTDEKYPCIQYQNNFKFINGFQLRNVIKIDGLAIYSKRIIHTTKTIEMYDRIEIKFDSNQEYTNAYIMDFNVEIRENEQEEARKLLQRLTGEKETIQSSEIEEENTEIEEENEYERSAQALYELGVEEKLSNIPLNIPSNIPLHITSIKYSKIDATFYIPLEQEDFEFYILKDLILNDEAFNIMAVDESRQAGREKDTVYLHMKNYGANHEAGVRCSLSLGETETDAFVRNELSSIGSKAKQYLRIRVIRITELEDLGRLREVIKRMFGLYLDKWEAIRDEYSQYMTLEHKKAKKEKKKRKLGSKLKDVDSVTRKLFGETYYSYACGKPRQPDILDLPEGYNKKDQKYPYEIIFPIPPYEGAQYLFGCSNKKKRKRTIRHANSRRLDKYQYAGLKRNTSTKAKLDVSKRHPFIPCCFESSLEKRKKPKNIREITKEYFEGKYGFGSLPKDEEEKDDKRKKHFQTMKLLEEGDSGDAPSSITNLIFKVNIERQGFDGTLWGCVKGALGKEVALPPGELRSHRSLKGKKIFNTVKDEIDKIQYLEDAIKVNIWVFSNQEAIRMGGKARIGKLIDTKKGVSLSIP